MKRTSTITLTFYAAQSAPVEPITTGAPKIILHAEPDGLTFAQPVTLTFAYDDALLDGRPPSTLQVLWWNEGANEWVTLDTILDEENRQIHFIRTGFSWYALEFGAVESAIRLYSAETKTNRSTWLLIAFVLLSMTVVIRRQWYQPPS